MNFTYLGTAAADDDTRFILNHFSHNGGLLHHQLEERGAEAGMEPSYDGMSFTL